MIAQVNEGYVADMSDLLVSEEEQRLAALHHYEVLGTAPEADFDDIAVLAAQLTRCPSAAVSLVGADRQFLKARVGIDQLIAADVIPDWLSP